MKKLTTLFIATTLAISSIAPAQADWGRHGGYGEYGHHEYRRSGPGWVGPAAVLAITGLAIGAAVASQHSYAPAPAYSYAPAPVYYNAAPRPMPADYGTWYYCGSSGQYYPYTNACPEGWQAVPAR